MARFSVVLFTAPPFAGAELGGAFVKVDGRECLLRSVELFLNRDNIKQIQLAVTQDAMEEAKRKYGGHLGFSGVKLVTGGPRWIDQIAAAGDKISDECTHVLDESGEVAAVLTPQRFSQIVTPWAFGKIRFLEMAKSRNEPSPGEITLLRGSALNVRVGSAADASLTKTMIGMLPKPKIRAGDNPFEEAQW
jgi:hypothetical protein